MTSAVNHATAKPLKIEVGATEREPLKEGGKPKDPLLLKVHKAWTGYIDGNFTHPLAYTYGIPKGMSQQQAVVEIAKRLPISANLDWINFSKFFDVDVRETGKSPAKVMPKLKDLCSTIGQGPELIANEVLAFLAKSPENGFADAIVTCHNKDGSKDRYDGELVALIAPKTNEITFLLVGNLFKGKYDRKAAGDDE